VKKERIEHLQSGSRKLPKFNRDILVQRYICDKIFINI